MYEQGKRKAVDGLSVREVVSGQTVYGEQVAREDGKENS